MKQLTPVRLAGGFLAAAAPLQAPTWAGMLSGTASYRERIARADAPATVLGRVRLEPAGQPPFRFSIPYREDEPSPKGRYAVRATVRQGDRLLFSTDTVTPVLDGATSQPLNLRLVRVGAGRQPSPQAVLGPLPASWRGDLPAASGTSRWQVDLLADGTFQLRHTFLDRSAPNSFDDIGRWRLEAPGPRLVLRGGREAPVMLQPLEGGAALRKLDLQGEPIRSALNDRLLRLPAAEPLEPRLHLQGMFRYLADAASIRLCATGARLPVAMEGDYLRLEREYLEALPAGGAGAPLLVNLEGLISLRPSAEPGRPAERTLVVERFVGVHPGEGCPTAEESGNPAATSAETLFQPAPASP